MSAGPRACITKVFDIDMARPRDLTDPKVAQLFRAIEALLAPDIAEPGEDRNET
jgi:hypothetical protein